MKFGRVFDFLLTALIALATFVIIVCAFVGAGKIANSAELTIEGPASSICGDRVPLRAALNGATADYLDWQIEPAGTAGLKAAGDSGDFTTRFPGTYVVRVVAAWTENGKAKASQASHVVEMLRDPLVSPPKDSTAATPAPANTVDNPPARPAPAARQIREVTAQDRIAAMTDAVDAPNKAADLAQLRSALLMTAGSIDAGMLPIPVGEQDVLGYLLSAARSQAALAMGADMQLWSGWFAEFEALVREVAADGFGSPANFATMLRNTEKALR